MNPLQIALLILIAISGIPAGILLKNMTKEEMKPGRRWFSLVSKASLAVILISLIFSRENLPFYMTVLSFVFFISIIPLIKTRNH